MNYAPGIGVGDVLWLPAYPIPGDYATIVDARVGAPRPPGDGDYYACGNSSYASAPTRAEIEMEIAFPPTAYNYDTTRREFVWVETVGAWDYDLDGTTTTGLGSGYRWSYEVAPATGKIYHIQGGA
jgi:hypothetical protein